VSRVKRLLASVGLSVGSLLVAAALTVAAYVCSVWALTHSKMPWMHQGDTTAAGAAVAAAVFASSWEISRKLRSRPERSIVSPDRSDNISLTFINNLPAEPAAFTGRSEAVTEILQSFRRGSSAGTPLLVTAGVGGIGKTALALHCAHQGLRDGMFPGGALFINLQGYGETKPLAPQAALYEFLRLLGAADSEIPQNTETRSSLYRALLAHRAKRGMRTLIILDNAELASQVEPLLPGSAEHSVLITTRETFRALAARRLELDTISLSDAVELIRQQLRVTAPTDARAEGYLADTQRIATACGCLPLALWMAAAILRGNPHLSLADLARELESPAGLDRLALSANESVSSPSQVFAASYTRLSESDALTFRMLGAMPGLTVSTIAVAVTAGMTTASAAYESLSHLQQAHLVSRDSVSGRWQVHDLLRKFAAKLMESPDREAELSAALRRVLEYYVLATNHANRWIGPRPDHGPGNIFSSEDDAFAFLDAEKGTTVECVRISLREDLALYGWRIAISLDRYLNACRDLASATEVLSLACDAADTLVPRNNFMLAVAHNRLGWALREMGRYPQASQSHRLAAQYAEADNSLQLQCGALEYLGVSLWHEGRSEDAIEVFEQTIALCGNDPDLLNLKAMATDDRGLCYRSLGRFDDALTTHQEALRIYSDLGEHDGIGVALYNMGCALVVAGQPSKAIPILKESIANRDNIGRTANHPKALALMQLGRAYRDDGQRARALEALAEALQIFAANNDLRHQAVVYQVLGQTERRSDKAFSAYQHSLRLYTQLGETVKQVEVQREIAALANKNSRRISLHLRRRSQD
jgi:tetratricopeptide (TPR) repeat protein